MEMVTIIILLLMQHSQGENPEAYIDPSMTYSAHLRKTDRLSNKQTLFEQCRNILQRPHQNRIPADNQTLLQLVEKNELLKQLAELHGLDFVKGVLRNAKLEFLDEGQVIAEEEQDIKYTVILLQGKIGVQRSSSDQLQQSSSLQQSNLSAQQQQALQNMTLKTQALFDKLTLLAKRQREAQRKASKLKRKNTIPISEYKFMLPVLTKHDLAQAQANITRTVLINEQFGGKERLNGRFFKNRVISLEKSTIFIIEISFLFYWLEMAFKSKLKKNIQRMKSIPAFQILQNQKLGEIIVSMKLVKRGKNSCVYFQGDPAEMIYLLVDGQLKVSKQADLFKENPNALYTDRRRLIQQQKKSLSRSLKDPQQDLLPFANLTTLYNYRPTKKVIDMGLISSFGLFGEEEVIFKTKRQTTIQVSSIEASYYQIQLKKVLEIIGHTNPKNIDRFREALEASVSKKILYRQKQFAEQVHFQNTANLNYFYLEDGKGDKSPKRVKLDRINQRVEPKIAKEGSDITPTPAYFTTFNFNKMFGKRYSTIDKKTTTKSTHNQSSTENLPVLDLEYNRAEQKVVDISHTWHAIQRRVRQEGRVSKRLSPFKHQINIEQPLIDPQFFSNVAKQQQRINKQERNIRFSLGKRNK